MKTLYNNISWLLCILITGTACMNASKAQQASQDIKGLVEAKNYVFVAQSANPLGGRFRQLNSADYDLRVSPDTVVSFLPYFGRAYTAPIDPSQGGIQFTSSSFEYLQTPRKKGGWHVTIRPKDAQDVREMTMTITDNGNASLQVISNSRQSISFNGYIRARK